MSCYIYCIFRMVSSEQIAGWQYRYNLLGYITIVFVCISFYFLFIKIFNLL